MTVAASINDQVHPSTSTLRLLTEQQASGLLNMSAATLRTWRCLGFGPNYQKLGRAVRYRESEIHAFIASGTVTAVQA